MKKFIIFGMICLFISCKSKKTADVNASAATISKSEIRKFTLENLARNTSAQDIQKNYAEAPREDGVGRFEEGATERAYTILYPGTKNEIQLIWETQAKANLYQVVFSESGDWRSRTGVVIGTTYDELVKQNGKQIKVYGFGWDYSGAVDWNGGKLANSKLRVFMKPKGEPANKFYGDEIISPTPQELAKLNLTVGSIIYHLGDD